MPEKDSKKDDVKEEKKTEGDAPKAAESTPSPPKQGTSISIPMDMAGLDSLFTKPIILLGILFGVLLQFLGAIMLNFDVSHSVSAFMGNLGIFFMVVVLFGGAITNEKMDPTVRMGMFIAGAVCAIGYNTWIYG